MEFFKVDNEEEEKVVHRHYHFFHQVSGEAFCFGLVAIVIGFLGFHITRAIQQNNTEESNVEISKIQKSDPHSQCQYDYEKCQVELKSCARR